MTKKQYQKIAEKREIKLLNMSRDRDLPRDILIASEDNYKTDKAIIDMLAGSTIL